MITDEDRIMFAASMRIDRESIDLKQTMDFFRKLDDVVGAETKKSIQKQSAIYILTINEAKIGFNDYQDNSKGAHVLQVKQINENGVLFIKVPLAFIDKKMTLDYSRNVKILTKDELEGETGEN